LLAKWGDLRAFDGLCFLPPFFFDFLANSDGDKDEVDKVSKGPIETSNESTHKKSKKIRR
jgi:hypothetical protein